MTRTAPRSLRWARELVDPAMREAAARLEPGVREIVDYHLGWADAAGRPARAEGGKAVRPALALLSAEAAGGDARAAIPGAVAVELVHNYSLLHDDVMDRDRERRHRPTAWALYGEARAIVAGDGLLSLAFELLLEDPARPRAKAARILARAASLMVAGQSEDLTFESRLDVTVEECRAMCGHKTGALLSASCEVGAVLAGAGERAARGLAAFGLHLGLAFQAVDDLLGIWGSPEATGKPAWSDLRRHKKSLPVAAALAVGTGAGRLRDLLANGALDEAALEEAARVVEEAGGRSRTEDEARRSLARALSRLDGLGLEPAGAGELADLARFVVGRDH